MRSRYRTLQDVQSKISAAFPACIECGRFPTCQMMRDRGCGSLVGIIRKRFGGYKFVSESMGCVSGGLLCEDGHVVYSNLEMYVDNVLFRNWFDHEYNCRIDGSTRMRCDFKLDSGSGPVFVEVWGFCALAYNLRRAKKESFYRSNGYTVVGIEKGELSKKDAEDIIVNRILDSGVCRSKARNHITKDGHHHVEGRIREYMTNTGRFPSADALRKIKDWKFLVSIVRTGGFVKWRERIGANIPKRMSDEKIVHELKSIHKRYGRIPAVSELRRLGYGRLAGTMNKKASINHYRRLAGFSVITDNTPQNESTVLSSLMQCVLHFRRFPTQKMVNEYYHGNSISMRIWRILGGMSKARDILLEKFPDERVILSS